MHSWWQQQKQTMEEPMQLGCNVSNASISVIFHFARGNIYSLKWLLLLLLTAYLGGSQEVTWYWAVHPNRSEDWVYIVCNFKRRVSLVLTNKFNLLIFYGSFMVTIWKFIQGARWGIGLNNVLVWRSKRKKINTNWEEADLSCLLATQVVGLKHYEIKMDNMWAP